MIGPGAGARVMVATRPVDFRKGPDALAALVGAEYGGDPYSGVIYVFRAKRSDRIKLVWWDGTGLCLMAKKLETGGFKWPGIQDGVMRLTKREMAAVEARIVRAQSDAASDEHGSDAADGDDTKASVVALALDARGQACLRWRADLGREDLQSDAWRMACREALAPSNSDDLAVY